MSEQNAKRDWSEAKRTSQGRVNCRFTDPQKALLEERAALVGINVATYVKAKALGDPIPRRTSRPVNADAAAILKMLAELGKLGSNANQIARANNVLARRVAAEPVIDLSEVKAAISAGNQNLEQINATLEILRSAIFDALNLG